jgi:hypothetical protein
MPEAGGISLPFRRVHDVAHNDPFGVRLTTRAQRAVWPQISMHQRNRLSLLSPIDEHLTPRARRLVSGPLQVPVFPEPLYQFSTFDLAR